MPKTIQIRNVPENLHHKLEVRAAEFGMTLSDYLLGEVRQLTEKQTLQDMLARLAEEVPLTLDETPAEIIRRHRDRE